MSSATDYLEKAIVEHMLGIASYASPSKVFMALGTASPNESDQTSWSAELSGSGYERAGITFNPAYKDTGSGTFFLRSGDPIKFPKATAAWNNISHFSLWDAKTGGNMLFFGSVGLSITVNQDKYLVLEAGWAAHVSFAGQAFKDYVVLKLLNHFFSRQPFTAPSGIHLGLFGMSGEISGGGYARKSWSAWNTVSQVNGKAQTSNNGEIRFNQASASWGMISNVALFDAATGGNELGRAMGSSAWVNQNDTAVISSGNLKVDCG